MNIHEYISSLNDTQKNDIININWTLLKEQADLTTPYAQEILSTIINNSSIIPIFHPSEFKQDLKLLNTIDEFNNFESPFIQHFFDILITQAQTWQKCCYDNKYNDSGEPTYTMVLMWNPKSLAKYFHYSFNNTLSADFIKNNYTVPFIVHPVFSRANKILESALEDPSIFNNFPAFFTSNKKFLGESSFSEKDFFLRSQDPIINQALESTYTLYNQINNDKNIAINSEDNIEFIQLQQDQFYTNIVKFFTLYPQIYQDYGLNKIPPIFFWSQYISNNLEYYSQFNKEHLDIIIDKNYNKNYDHFVEQFIGGRSFNKYSDEYLLNYFQKLMEKNLPLNELIAKMKKPPININNINYNELAEKYLKESFNNKTDELKDIHLLFKKYRFEQLVNNTDLPKNKKTARKI